MRQPDADAARGPEDGLAFADIELVAVDAEGFAGAAFALVAAPVIGP
jgi:hypothetical protein